MIERVLLDITLNGTMRTAPGVHVKQMPYPCYIHDRFMLALGNAMPLFMTLAWVYAIAMQVKQVVIEKETRLKEVMKVQTSCFL